uniref:Gypsy retrotransposon integrase-like protein 1 n=1 Tax=Sander lucioperca TaxID=283035 RepID=A0A8D0CUG7_SANLU
TTPAQNSGTVSHSVDLDLLFPYCWRPEQFNFIINLLNLLWLSAYKLLLLPLRLFFLLFPAQIREPFVPAPERYDGNMGTCGDFLTQCSLVFEQQPLTYASERSRIAYLINSTSGSARSWGSAVWESQSDVCNSYVAFTTEMRKVFDHPVRGKEAAKRLFSLRQGSRSVAEMAVEFRTLAAVSGWNDEALQGVFINALSETLKDELVSHDESPTLDNLISLTIRLDNRIRERRRERRALNPKPWRWGVAGSSLMGEVLVSRAVDSSSSPRILLQASLQWQSQNFPVSALVDSGADESFLDRELAKQMVLDTIPMDRPLQAKGLNGQLLTRITHQTVPVCLRVSGNHQENIQFHIIDCPQTPLVLGIPWLIKHNPHIDWVTGRIVSWSTFCHVNCLCSAQTPASTVPQPPLESMDLSAVPDVYHDLASVFCKHRATSLPPHRPYDCAIDLQPGAPLPNSRLYNLSRPETEAMENYIRDSLAAGIIRPSSSPVGAGFFFVGKKDKTLRPCIDFRGLNNITIKNKYSLPLINSAFPLLHGATIFTKLDLRNAYHLVRIRKGDEWKTAFNTPLGHFEYLVMPFGLSNAPAVFQALVNDVLRDMLNRFVFVYLDDILIFSKSSQEHELHVRQVLQRLLENKLFVKMEKCEFHVSNTSFLGYMIAQGELRMDPAKISAVTDWPAPSTRKQLQRFLGFANFYRRFIKDYSRIAAPLTALTSISLPFEWNEGADSAFKELKHRFASAPILMQPDPDRQFVVEVDASDTGVGAVLSQRSPEDNKLHPCAFLSRKLSQAERNYDVGNRELLAVKLALEEWRHWLEGAEQPFIIWTDHKNLAYIQSAKQLNPRQARWALFFGRFNFSLSYRPGSRNVKPDALSRVHSAVDTGSNPETILPPTCSIAAITCDIEGIVRQAQHLQADPGSGPPNRLFVPESVRSQVLQWAHSSPLTCHPGVTRTLDFLRRKFWWPRMEADTRAFIAACTVCARSKNSTQASAGHLRPLPIPSRPWSHIALDFVTGLPPSSGKTVILTVIDRFSKFAHFLALPKLPTARETADILVKYVFRSHGLPTDIVSDRGPQFISQVWKAFCKALGITSSLSSGYHPQTNGQAERANQEMETALRCVTGSNPGSWSSMLPWSGFQLQLIHHNHLSLKYPVNLATHRQIIAKISTLVSLLTQTCLFAFRVFGLFNLYLLLCYSYSEPDSCLRFTPATIILLSTTGRHLDSPRTLGQYGTTPAQNSGTVSHSVDLDLLFPYCWRPEQFNFIINLLNLLWLSVMVCIWVQFSFNRDKKLPML